MAEELSESPVHIISDEEIEYKRNALNEFNK